MDLTIGSIPKHIKNISIPAGVGLFFNTMFNVVDTFFAGQVSTQARASLSISFPVFFMILALNNGITVGSSALISNALGESALKEAKRFSAQALSFGVVSALFITVVGLLSSQTLLSLLGATGAYLDQAESYINLIFYGAIFFVMNASANSILLAHGNSKTMRNFLIISFFLNAVLDPWFLYGGLGLPAMGLRGIALATVLTMFFGNFILIGRVVKENHLKGVKVSDFIPRLHIFLEILRQSLPASLNLMSIALGIFVTTYYVKEFGSEAVAAFGIGMRVQQIFLVPSLGITVSIVSIVGQNNGAGLFDRIEEAVNEAFKYGALCTGAGSLIAFVFPGYIFSLFSSSEEVIAIGIPYLRIAAFTTMAYIVMALYTAMLQGMKRPNFAFILSVGRQVVAPIIIFPFVIYVLHSNIVGLWLTVFVISWIGAAVAYFYGRHVISLRKRDLAERVKYQDFTRS